MAIASYIWYLILIVVMVCAIGAWVVYAMLRKAGSRVLVLERDFRNMNAPRKNYYAMFDKKNKNKITLYANLFTPLKTKIIPPFDMEAYVHDKRIFGYQGISEHPEDSIIVPVHYPLVGRAGARAFQRELSGAIIEAMQFYDGVKGLRLEDRVHYPGKNGQEYILTRVGAIGEDDRYLYVELTSTKDFKLVKDQQVFKTKLLNNPEEISDIKVVEESDNPEITYSDVMDTLWVMKTFGIIPIDDVNVVLDSTKNSIIAVNSAIEDRRLRGSSWWSKNAAMVFGMVAFLVIVIGAGIMYSFITQDVASLTAAANGAMAAAKGYFTVNSIASALPK